MLPSILIHLKCGGEVVTETKLFFCTTAIQFVSAMSEPCFLSADVCLPGGTQPKLEMNLKEQLDSLGKSTHLLSSDTKSQNAPSCDSFGMN